MNGERTGAGYWFLVSGERITDWCWFLVDWFTNQPPFNVAQALQPVDRAAGPKSFLVAVTPFLTSDL
ncbi:MAG: hypothetical protein ACLFWL_18610 [Candidatus Brocadiia bacterium]